MKKNFFYAAFLAAGLMTISTSCSKDDEIINGGDNTEVATGEQVIVLDMQDTDVLSTKSRPLYSTTNQGAERVTDVKLFIFKHSKTTGEPMTLENILTINNWSQNSSDYNYGRQYSLKLEGDDKLDVDETYTILAVGQDESSIPTSTAVSALDPYKIMARATSGLLDATYISNATWDEENNLQNATWNASATAGNGFLITSDKDEANNTRTGNAEIFSGCSQPIDIVLDGGFRAEVLLKRQVAGVLGYFSKIPAIVAGSYESGAWYTGYKAVKKIRLVSHAKNNQIDLTRSLYDQKDDATEVGNEYVVNGFSSAEAEPGVTFKNNTTENSYTIYEINLSDWFKVAEAEADDASYWYGTSFTTGGAENIKFEDGSLPTLGETLKYQASNSNTEWTSVTETLPSPTWVNALSQSNSMPAVAENSVLAGKYVIPFNRNTDTENNTFELQLLGGSDEILKSWNVRLDAVSINAEQGDSEYAFNIYRNHLYQIGKRGAGDDPTNPGTDPDKPQPLDKDQELTIKINDQWEFIHDLEID